VSVFTVPLSVTPATNVCAGNTVVLNASGATTYTWSNGTTGGFNPVSPATTTVYTVSAVTPTSGMNCSSTASVLVTVNPLPVVTATVNRAQICKNETATVTAAGAQTYSWNTLSTAPSFTIKGVSPSYTFMVNGTDNNGCTGTGSVTLKVNNCTTVSERDALNRVSIFPNPSRGEFTVISAKPCRLQMVDVSGRSVMDLEVVPLIENHFNASHLPAGIYFITGFENDHKENFVIIR
jgi:hypothetical protein